MTIGEEAALFERHRSGLTGLAYRMLGSRAEAEDAVQDAWLRWRGRGEGSIDDPGRYLAAIVTRLCLDRLKSAKARRETYIGPWLPEPLVDEALAADSPSALADDLSVAMMLALERLSPLERAAFLLHDVFDLAFAEVAASLGRSEVACRQLASRARRQVRSQRPRFPASREEGVRLAGAFEAAVRSGDTAELAALLAADAVLYSDGGGKRPAALRPIAGADEIAKLVIHLSGGGLTVEAIRPAMINGLAGFVLRERGGPISTIAFETGEGCIRAIYIMRNPDKLAHVRL